MHAHPSIGCIMIQVSSPVADIIHVWNAWGWSFWNVACACTEAFLDHVLSVQKSTAYMLYMASVVWLGNVWTHAMQHLLWHSLDYSETVEDNQTYLLLVDKLQIQLECAIWKHIQNKITYVRIIKIQKLNKKYNNLEWVTLNFAINF